MTSVAALTGKVKFVNTGTTQYRVEILLNNRNSKWVQHFNSFDAAIKHIENEKKNNTKSNIVNCSYLVTEVFTKTLGVF